MKDDSLFTRLCPQCNRMLSYTRNYTRKLADKNKSLCSFCVNGGMNNPMFGKASFGMLGKKQSKKFRCLISKRMIGTTKSILTKEKISCSVKLKLSNPDVRKRHLDALHHSQWLKVRTDKGQLELLEKWNRLGFQFQPNFQVKTDTDLFYIDGYDGVNSVVLEYDTKYHKKYEQKQRDEVRQQRIIDILKPRKFWRYDSTSRLFTTIL